MKKYVLISLALLCFVTTSFASDNPYFQKAVFVVTGEIIDTHKELILPENEYISVPHFDLTGMTISVKEWAPEENANEPLPIFTAYMRQMASKLRVRNAEPSCKPILKKHSKALGIGVYGPLKVKGKLSLWFRTYEKKKTIIADFSAEEIKGTHRFLVNKPIGSWPRNH